MQCDPHDCVWLFCSTEASNRQSSRFSLSTGRELPPHLLMIMNSVVGLVRQHKSTCSSCAYACPFMQDLHVLSSDLNTSIKYMQECLLLCVILKGWHSHDSDMILWYVLTTTHYFATQLDGVFLRTSVLGLLLVLCSLHRCQMLFCLLMWFSWVYIFVLHVGNH